MKRKRICPAFIAHLSSRIYPQSRKSSGRLPFKIHAYYLMTDHIHLEVQIAETPLSKVMQTVALRYAQWFNWRHGKSGHLFQGRCKAILVQADEYLKEVAANIYLTRFGPAWFTAQKSRNGAATQPTSGKKHCLGWETDFMVSTFSSSDRKPATSVVSPLR